MPGMFRGIIIRWPNLPINQSESEGFRLAKNMYKIPYGLNMGYGDMEISFRSKDGLGTKPIPIKVICAYMVSILACFFIVSRTVVASGTLLQKAVFVLLWAALTIVLLKCDSTKRMQIELIPTLLNYVRKSNRLVLTRRSENAVPFYNIAGIKDIKKNGLVEYIDGTVGYWYRVVGSASILLFDADRKAILDRVDSFYQRADMDAEIIFMTTKSSQQVYRQIASLKRRFEALDTDDEELRAVANEQFFTLRDYVGSGFKCIHQYMILKGDNLEALQRAKNILRAEAEGSSLMIKRCSPMYYDDIVAALKLVYTGKGV